MTSFWILLFIICLPKTGSTGENPADYGHYTHDLSLPPLPQCPPFVEAGTPDLLWLYKSQRKAWKKGEIGKRKTRKPEKKKSKTEELNRKSLEEQRRKTQHTEEEKQGKTGRRNRRKSQRTQLRPRLQSTGNWTRKPEAKKKKKNNRGEKGIQKQKKSRGNREKKQRNAQK